MRDSFTKFLGVLFLTIFCSNQGYSEDAYYIIPIKKVAHDRSYTQKDLELIFREFSSSFNGKNIWSLAKANNSSGFVVGAYLPDNLSNTAEDDLAAYCYRCGLGRGDLVKEEDCTKHNFKWIVKNLSDLTSCN